MTESGNQNEVSAQQVQLRTDVVSSNPPSGFVAIRLIENLKRSGSSLCYIALSENSAEAVAEAIRGLFPEVDLVVLPPWDCLPYDRVAPSRRSMGRRMDALRVWSRSRDRSQLLVTSLEAILQRLPPLSVIKESRLELAVGDAFDRNAFENFVRCTGYVEEAVADDPGEFAIRDEMIDIFPAGAPSPMRILLSENNTVEELRTYDPATQRTVAELRSMVFGPASELVHETSCPSPADVSTTHIEQSMMLLYGQMPTLFDLLVDVPVLLAPRAQQRVEQYLDFIEEAREAYRSIGEGGVQAKRSLYLDRDEWRLRSRNSQVLDLDPQIAKSPPQPPSQTSARATLEHVQKSRKDGYRVVIAGEGRQADGLCRRIEKATGCRARPVKAWNEAIKTGSDELPRLSVSLETGFVHEATKTVVLAFGAPAGSTTPETISFREPDLTIGDVVVHEDHGVGILRNLESTAVEGETRDTARLEYRDGAAVLVPMEDFDKLWRYGSEPEAISLDRLHTDTWTKKKEQVAKDIRVAARHLVKAARERHAVKAERLIPPKTAYDAFVRRFPHSETTDQISAVGAVLSDLASGTVMNRIICGDVGFGKTEIALRAAAAVALAGGQVAVIAPTTVLVRQHFATFQLRFNGTGIKVGMLSRLSKASEAKAVKEGLSNGDISIVVATQAVLAKDVRFSRLALLVIDEEHRFGIREKRAMTRLGSSVHTLAMSATPIPRTLQCAMIGIQDVNLLQVPPNKRRPVRTTFGPVDRASIRVALLRESRRGGQSFVVVPRRDDIAEVEAVLRQTVPELIIKIAHGKMPAAEIDVAVVDFATGDGDVLLSTNIIENGLDVPRANTILIWRAEMFGLAQLHQLRGRVGRGRAQGIAYCITGEVDLSEGARQRLQTLVENDRLGSGLSISLRDLDLRGGGDILGEDQAGHMKMIGVGLYHKMLERAVASLNGRQSQSLRRAATKVGAAGSIPDDYVSDPAVRLNLYARLLRASSVAETTDLAEEFEDRFGELPEATEILLRNAKLQITAARLGVRELVAGRKALSVTVSAKTPSKTIKAFDKRADVSRCDDRIIFNVATQSVAERLLFFERLFGITPMGAN